MVVTDNIPAPGRARKGHVMTIEEMQQKKRELGLTYEEIAERSGLSVPTVQRIISGTTQNPRDYSKSLIEGVLSGFVIKEEPAFTYMTKKQGEYTIDDYYELPEEERCELIDGYIYDMATPTEIHQEIACILYRQLREHVDKNKGSCLPLISPLDMAIEKKTVVQPDVQIRCRPFRRDAKGHPLPDFVAEVISPSSRRRDYLLKLGKYIQAGVKEYWIIDYDKDLITVYLFGEEDSEVRTYRFRDPVPVSIWDGSCVIDFSSLDTAISEWGDLFESEDVED